MAFLNCCRCSTQFWVDENLHRVARASQSVSFYCAYGHEQHFPQGETEEQKLRRDRDRLAQKIAEKDDTIREVRLQVDRAKRQAAAARGSITKIRRRVGNGVCPCCNRMFSDLHHHMNSKHPSFSTEDA